MVDKDNELKEVRIYAKIPFLIMVNDGLDSEGKIISPNGFPIIDYELGITGELYFKQQINKNSFSHQLFQMPSEDFYGELTYSLFCLLLKGNDAKKLNDKYHQQSSPDYIEKLTSRIVNRFIEIYRVESSKYWIEIPTYKRLSPFQIQFNNTVVNTMKDISNHNVIDFRGTGNMINSSIDSNIVSNIKKQLLKNTVVKESLRFLIEANKYKQRGDYKSFILFFAFYIESWIIREIKVNFTILGKDDLFIHKFLHKNNGKKKSSFTILRDFINSKTNFAQLQNSTEYKQYRVELADRRNSLAHGEMIDVDFEKAESIIKIGAAYRDYLLENYTNKDYKKNHM